MEKDNLNKMISKMGDLFSLFAFISMFLSLLTIGLLRIKSDQIHESWPRIIYVLIIFSIISIILTVYKFIVFKKFKSKIKKFDLNKK